MYTEYSEATFKKMKRRELLSTIEELINDKKALEIKLEEQEAKCLEQEEAYARLEETHNQLLEQIEKMGNVEAEARRHDQLVAESRQIEESSREMLERTKQEIVEVLESFKGDLNYDAKA
ncbi:hypothetical protein LJC51_06980 [Lachnospiraceae bacterium OttesenSCG-928-J05]|nr:hypothetical protein [Lachnospiraceae bacterium OttesenSCG-928-J05]